MWKNIKAHGVSKKGTTMVEVLVAFLVVMLMMGMFSKVVTTSVHLLRQSREIIDRTEKFNAEYLLTDSQAKRKAVPDGGKVALILDTEKTSASLATPVSIALANGRLVVYTSESSQLKRYSFDNLDIGKNNKD